MGKLKIDGLLEGVEGNDESVPEDERATELHYTILEIS